MVTGPLRRRTAKFVRCQRLPKNNQQSWLIQHRCGLNLSVSYHPYIFSSELRYLEMLEDHAKILASLEN